ncbi:MAG: Lar family restriction alleviation protein [Treponema sp.]|nr:Lar family restriction alleviation protein [Treponema sp.]
MKKLKSCPFCGGADARIERIKMDAPASYGKRGRDEGNGGGPKVRGKRSLGSGAGDRLRIRRGRSSGCRPGFGRTTGGPAASSLRP